MSPMLALKEGTPSTTGKQYRPFRDRQALINWYNRLHTDAAEYRMWGNGIALPCARFVLAGIAAAENE